MFTSPAEGALLHGRNVLLLLLVDCRIAIGKLGELGLDVFNLLLVIVILLEEDLSLALWTRECKDGM